jgi:uncharacterized spore protein YtfJ
MTTDLKTDIDFESAMAAARKAATSAPADGMFERLAERVGARASVRAVFGDPIERDGLTVIPVARVRWAFGGANSGPVPVGPGLAGDGGTTTIDEAGQPGSGMGAGGAAMADPIGHLEIGPAGATFRPIRAPLPSPALVLAAGLGAALVIRAIARLLRG